jgi:hypothetical protein
VKKVILLLAVAFISLPAVSFGWGKKGHTIIAEIAYSFLDDAAKEAVNKYLGNTTLGEAGCWMDNVRRHHEYDYMKSWHYVNVEKGCKYAATKDANIINALNTAIYNLEHKEKQGALDIKTNLMILFHLTGDLHQPLHVGYAIDKGGNNIRVSYLGRSSNLHAVWDAKIIESEKITTEGCLALLKNMSKANVAKLKQINIEAWTQQQRLLLGSIYDFDNYILDRNYVDKHKKVVEQQLLIAGIRLSAILQHVFR